MVGSSVAFVGLIYLHGYPLPGTPTLAKRYFPDWLLRRFEKTEVVGTESEYTMFAEGAEEIDPEPYLRKFGAIEPCQGGTDRCLTDEFRFRWRTRIKEIRELEYEDELRSLWDWKPDKLTIDTDGDGCAVHQGENTIAMWGTEAALVADVAALPELQASYPPRQEVTPIVQNSLIHGLRVFLEWCPLCDSQLSFSENTVESCCR